ncbi:hypothetical protein N656DRAFT_114299 [Canariomyces notabilis]|uniref:Uncharacterized protein n=1 Tax=Canariomyces notabilis TaxID=2074819 RepID=A0AAN6TDP0_9PEZI|nr:hypothetical protein N656DRAFT_114299 [Canariomyces arenarius]
MLPLVATGRRVIHNNLSNPGPIPVWLSVLGGQIFADGQPRLACRRQLQSQRRPGTAVHMRHVTWVAGHMFPANRAETRSRVAEPVDLCMGRS